MRQVLTYPDLPPVLTQAVADTRYEPLDSAYTKAESDAKYLTQALGDARYSLTAHLHTGVYLPVSHEPGVDPHTQYYNQTRGDARYQPLGSYLTTAVAASTYLPLTGGTLTGPLIAAPTATEAYSLVARNDRARASFQANTDTVIGRVGHEYAGAGMSLSNNLRTTTASGGWVRDDAAKLGANLAIGSGTTILNLASSTAASGNAPATLINRMQMLPTGGLALIPDAGLPVLEGISSSRPHVRLKDPTANSYARYGHAFAGSAAYVTQNCWYDGTNWNLDSTGEQGIVFTMYAAVGADPYQFSLYAPGANPATPRTRVSLAMSPQGFLRVKPDTGYAGLYIGSQTVNENALTLGTQIGGSNQTSGRVGSMEYLFLDPQGNYVLPGRDAAILLGSGALRWASLYVVNAPVVGSHADLKEDFQPLDPKACVDAVVETDWLSYTYKPPTYTPPDPIEGDEPEAKGVRLDGSRAAYAKLVVETAPARHQKGYVLGHEVFNVHDLFGLSDRESRSDGADLAVVACALQGALKRIATLETHILALEAR